MYNPFSKGRWYRFVINSDGTTPTLTKSDLAGSEIVEHMGYYLVLPSRYNILSIVPDIYSKSNENDSISQSPVVSIMPTGSQACLIPAPFSFTSMELYIFAKKG